VDRWGAPLTLQIAPTLAQVGVSDQDRKLINARAVNVSNSNPRSRSREVVIRIVRLLLCWIVFLTEIWQDDRRCHPQGIQPDPNEGSVPDAVQERRSHFAWDDPLLRGVDVNSGLCLLEVGGDVVNCG